MRKSLNDNADEDSGRDNPWVPALFVLASLALLGNTLVERPAESLLGLGLVALGLPAYAYWRRARSVA